MTGDEYTPTNHLRILVIDDWREIGANSVYMPKQTLQQLWVREGYDMEWRDVPEVYE